ncbi:DHA2 family efflux MFS transporter permease subunit [Dietzia alimentaria]|uniref:DHA2 family efflux MFS transporter permease subunit n=1 Tax=Dietzia alimentaria TaxID=665550 RepID=UPI00029A608D|nr:DHA2 family efflux MFS transporter permease subunit [Dietzia alimentaria]
MVASSSSPPVPERQAWLALTALCAGLFITLMDQALVAVALPSIRADLGASINQTVWVVAVYLLAFAAPLLVSGRLGDRFGQRNVYLAGMGVFTAAATAAAFAPTIELLIAARAVQGLGASLLNPQPLSIIHRVFARNRRGAAMGMWSAVASSAGLFGPILGGVIVGTAGWRWVFALYIPFGLLAVALVALLVPRLPTGVGRIDLVSAVFAIVAVLAVTLTLQQGPDLGWPLWLWAVLAAGVAASMVFVWLQFRARRLGVDALMPPALFANRNFALGSFSVFTLGFAVYSMNIPIMLYLQTVQELSAQVAGLMMIPTAVVSLVAAPFVGRLTDRTPPGVVSTSGFVSMIAAMLLFATMMTFSVPVPWLLVPLVLMGAANAMCWAANSAVSMRGLPPDLVGAGSGVYNTSRQVGAVVGAAALGAVMQVGIQATDFATAMGLTLVLPATLLVAGAFAVARFQPDSPQ